MATISTGGCWRPPRPGAAWRGKGCSPAFAALDARHDFQGASSLVRSGLMAVGCLAASALTPAARLLAAWQSQAVLARAQVSLRVEFCPSPRAAPCSLLAPGSRSPVTLDVSGGLSNLLRFVFRGMAIWRRLSRQGSAVARLEAWRSCSGLSLSCTGSCQLGLRNRRRWAVGFWWLSRDHLSSMRRPAATACY